MTSRLCSIEDCGRKHKGYGYCNKHYEKFKRYGDPLAGRENFPAGSRCSIENCHRPIEGAGLCAKHYQKNRRLGDPLAGKDRGPNGTGTIVPRSLASIRA